MIDLVNSIERGHRFYHIMDDPVRYQSRGLSLREYSEQEIMTYLWTNMDISPVVDMASMTETQIAHYFDQLQVPIGIRFPNRSFEPNKYRMTPHGVLLMYTFRHPAALPNETIHTAGILRSDNGYCMVQDSLYDVNFCAADFFLWVPCINQPDDLSYVLRAYTHRMHPVVPQVY